MSQVDFSSLSPQSVWQHFHTLCNIPRPSKHEQQLRQHLQQWAMQRGLETYIDQIGNLIIRKPATAGMQDTIGVILQGHLDMVTQANRGTAHDFMHDPIQPVVKDGWLIAENTTLGADNGIGVALALAVLDAEDIVHGPIEVLLTVDEEAGMSGARELESGILQGKWLFNIDTEEWGELYLGCAGSQDLEIQQTLLTQPTPEHLQYVDIQVMGLKGGHSGIDIHLGRGNANVILAGFLHAHLANLQAHLVSFQGGSARNALPREATARIALPTQQIEALQTALKQTEQDWQQRLHGIDDGLILSLQQHTQAQVDSAMDNEILEPIQQKAWLAALASCPYGVYRMSETLPDVVETSNNIGVVHISAQGAKALIMVRSMQNDEIRNLTQNIKAHFAQFGIDAELAPLVSGWTPNPDSQALKCLQQAYRDAFHIEPRLQVIHAGLECGIIAEHYPELQMVSFGPDIRGAHAPGERVNIETVGQSWQLLTTALALVPKK